MQAVVKEVIKMSNEKSCCCRPIVAAAETITPATKMMYG